MTENALPPSGLPPQASSRLGSSQARLKPHALTRAMRLLRGADFERVFRRKCSASDEIVIVYGLTNGLEHPRLGLSVSRKVGGAVVRNRWRRLIREAFRLSRPQLPSDLDMIVIPRLGVEPSLIALRESLPQLARRIRRRL